MKKMTLIICLFTFLMSCNTDTIKPVNTIVFHKTHEPKKSTAPFSDAVQVGNLFFLSGQVGMDHSVRKLVSGGIQPETRQTLENIKAVLEYHGMNMKDVVKCTVILADIEDFSVFNEIYKTYFPQKPARTTFAAKRLAVDAKIEIECIAVKPE
jgi:2-iminobutanoate/2-iminopropanoate deaminase